MYNNWEGKQERANQARAHAAEMKEKYSAEIEESSKNTKLFDRIAGKICMINTATGESKPIPDGTGTEPAREIITDMDSVEAVMKYVAKNDDTGRVCVLNFASYKNPGGKYLEGSRAQEECLCHESTLYNVLEQKVSYYAENQRMLNRALYTDRALYSPDVLFIHNGVIAKCDVLTCAAPNYRAYGYRNGYTDLTKGTNNLVLKQRIHFLLMIADEMNVSTFIAGAFGCGVFQQDPNVVAKYFHEEAQHLRNVKRIVYAIPTNRGTENFSAFEKMLEEAKKDREIERKEGYQSPWQKAYDRSYRIGFALGMIEKAIELIQNTRRRKLPRLRVQRNAPLLFKKNIFVQKIFFYKKSDILYIEQATGSNEVHGLQGNL